MKRLLFALMGLAWLVVPAGAQQTTRLCVDVTQTLPGGTTQKHCVPVVGTNPLVVLPTYTYVSAGASQMALAVGTNTKLTVPSGATLVQICVETAGIRYRDDGTAATTSVGQPVSAGTCFSYSGPLSALSFTAQSGSPTLDVSYYKVN